MATSLTRLIRRLIWILIGLFLVFFSVNNRQQVDLSFEPFDWIMPGVPVWWILFFGIFVGIGVTAAVASWLRLEGFARRRKAERRADYLNEQMAAMAEDAHEGRAHRAHKAATDEDGTTALAKPE